MTQLDGDGLWKDDPGKMTTITGRRVNPLTMTAEDVVVQDIAHALARQCRYNGHVGGYLSVARHSVWVAERLEEQGHPPIVVLTGLLHDAAEAYLGDMIRPLKHVGEVGSLYLTAELRLEEQISEAFGLPFPWDPAVKAADNHVLTTMELPRPGGARHTWYSHPDHDHAAFLRLYNRLQESM